MSWFSLSLVLLVTSIAMPLVMMVAWIIQNRTGNGGWIDVVWTFGLGAVAGLLALLPVSGANMMTGRQGLVAAMVLLWAARLGLHIFFRTQAIGDDPRYAHLRQEWGANAPRRMFWLLQAQAVASLPLVVAVVLAAHNPAPVLRPLDVLALVIFAAGLAGSAVADRQLSAFKIRHRPNSGVCDQGLWSWSRHPNYFFEWLIWFAYPCLALSLASPHDWGFLSLAAPACMYWLLTSVSGVPPLEAHMLRKHGDAYRRYQAKTNCFIPLPPRPTLSRDTP